MDARQGPVAVDLERRVHGRKVQVRRSFITRSWSKRDVSPLATVLRSGRGSSVRLKLLLSLLWVGSAPPHDLNFPARVWAELLDLPNPDGSGGRQIRSALRWLADHGFVVLLDSGQQWPTVRLLEETLTGVGYSVPGATLSALGPAEDRTEHFYVTLPPSLWLNGWIARLNGPALAMLLVVLDAGAGAEQGTPVWFSPRAFAERYGLSDGTRATGVAQLVDEGLIVTGKRPVGRDAASPLRMRTTYTLYLSRLDSTPAAGSPRPASGSLVSTARERPVADGGIWPQPALEKLASSSVPSVRRLVRIMDVLAQADDGPIPTSSVAERTGLSSSEVRSTWINLTRHLEKHYDGLLWPVWARWGPNEGLPLAETYYKLQPNQAKRWIDVRGGKLWKLRHQPG